MDIQQLFKLANDARLRAYVPYSRFQVGAALLGAEGQVFTGCNVENISFGLTVCAERNALFSAICAGARSFVRIVIVADSTTPISPCGACRQVLAEFAPQLEVISENLTGERFSGNLRELLPRPSAGILGT